jgi:hypothetical protein
VCDREAEHEDEHRRREREDERVGEPSLGPGREAQREPRDGATVVPEHGSKIPPVRRRWSAQVAVAALFFGARAGATDPFDDPYDLPNAPRPPTLPELTHPDLEATLESTYGVLVPAAGGGNNRSTYVQRLGVEIPIAERRWFVGTHYEFAAGGSGVRAVGGNLELFGRTVWATSTGLAFGGGFALVLPTANFDPGGPAGLAANDAATVRPWDRVFFTSDSFALRPFIDMRVIDHRFVIHFRQGVDVLDSVADYDGQKYTHDDYRVLAVTGLFIGYRVARPLAFGVEAFEMYVVRQESPEVPDRQRANLVVSPSVRLMTPYVQPALSFFTSVGQQPLDGGVDRVLGVRLAVTLVYDATTHAIERGTPGHGELE